MKSQQSKAPSADVSQGVTMDLIVSTENNDFLEDCPLEMSDAALVSTAKCGDTDAFVELTRRHSRRLLQTTYRITRNQQDAEDALQDSFLKAFSHLDSFQEKASFSTWLTRIAINSALMIMRKKGGHRELPIDGTDDSGGTSVRWEPESPTEDPESCFARREREELLRDAILRLPQIVREVVELRQTREYSSKEIAQALDLTIPAVKSRLARARSRLRAALLQPDSWSAESQSGSSF